MSSWWWCFHDRGGSKKGCGLNPGHQAQMEERTSDRGMPFSVSMRHAFVPFPGRVLMVFELLIPVGIFFKALIKPELWIRLRSMHWSLHLPSCLCSLCFPFVLPGLWQSVTIVFMICAVGNFCGVCSLVAVCWNHVFLGRCKSFWKNPMYFYSSPSLTSVEHLSLFINPHFPRFLSSLNH